MSRKLRKYLESIGLKASATEAQAWAFMATLEGEESAHARKLGAEENAEDGDEDGDKDEDEEEEEDGEKGDAEAADPPGGDDDEEEEEETASDSTSESAERGRVTSIMNLGSKFRMPESFVHHHVASGTSVRNVKAAIVSHQAATRAPVSIGVGPNLNQASVFETITDALAASGTPDRKLYRRNERGELVARDIRPQARGLVGKPFIKIAESWLAMTGRDPRLMSAGDLKRVLWDGGDFGGRRVAVHTTSDFDAVCANALNKSALREYAESPVTWPLWCRKGTAPDFNEIKRVALGEAPNLPEVREGGEYTLATVGDRKEVYTLIKYGRSFELTWEALLADNVGLFSRLPAMWVRAARRREEIAAIAALTGNGNMSDGNALFDASNHSNVAAGSDIDPPSVASLSAARVAMRRQTGISSDVILNIAPHCLIVPATLETVAERIINSENDPASSAPNVVNPFFRKLQLAVSPLLDQSSITQWFLAGDPKMWETVEVCFLDAYPTPVIVQTDQLNPDKRVFNCRHVVAAKALDWRALYANAGT